ncbi:MAG: hypothetical protein HYX27_10555 [Acidobacteria bacterium]|nr:hypothetical protein [Acidobacteriota bacterium]
MSVPQPYDQSFKLLADDDPRAALAAFAGIPLEAEIEVEPADRELNLPTLRVDNLYRCRQNGDEFLIHFEAVSRYRTDVLERQTEYVRAIIAKHKLACRSYLLLLTENGVPDRLPRFLESRFGDYGSRVRLRPVRLWRIPAQRILRLRRLSLVPWTALMRTEERDLEEAASILARSGQAGLTAQMALLMGLRYGKKELFEERLAHMTTEEIIQDSYFYQWIMEKGEKRGVSEVLTHQLTAKFGALPPWAVDRLTNANVETLNQWAVGVLTAATLEDCLQ